jgi:hypothetical protein
MSNYRDRILQANGAKPVDEELWQKEVILQSLVAFFLRLWQNLPLSEPLANAHRTLCGTLKMEYESRIKKIELPPAYEPPEPFSYGSDDDEDSVDNVIALNHPLPVGYAAAAIHLAETGQCKTVCNPQWGADGIVRAFRPSNRAIVERRQVLYKAVEDRILEPSDLTLNFSREQEELNFEDLFRYYKEMCQTKDTVGVPLIGLVSRLTLSASNRPMELAGALCNAYMHANRSTVCPSFSVKRATKKGNV